MNNGELSVLNCSTGDIRINFDKDDPQDVERAKRIIADMLKRGYLLFVEDPDGKTSKVESFDEKTCEYILADGPTKEPVPVAPEGAVRRTARTSRKCRTCGNQIKAGSYYFDRHGTVWHTGCASPAKGKKKRSRRPLKDSKATGVAPTSGG